VNLVLVYDNEPLVSIIKRRISWLSEQLSVLELVGYQISYTGWAKSPCAPGKSAVNLYLWFNKSHTHTLYGACVFCNILPRPWRPLQTFIVTVSTFTITYFQQVHRDWLLAHPVRFNVYICDNRMSTYNILNRTTCVTQGLCCSTENQNNQNTSSASPPRPDRLWGSPSLLSNE
jgi:hypothetical protein